MRVRACGVCRTDLDQVEGRIEPPRLPVVPGHQAVGRVVALGDGVTEHRPMDRVGVGWIHHSTGEADENLSPAFRATGRDSDGEPLGLIGFGGSAHLVLQIARHRYPSSPVYVFARRRRARETAGALGAAWAGPIEATPPRPPRAIIDTTPAWRPLIAALAALQPGGRLVMRRDDQPLSAAAFLADDQLEAGPDFVNRADLDIDQAEGERMTADVILDQVAGDAGGALRPGHPDHPIRDDLPHRRRQRAR